jgi:isopenicillin N synthase-like dioxygenase
MILIAFYSLEVGTAPDPKEAFNVWTSTGKIPNDRIPPYFKERDSKVQEFYSQCHQLSIKILRCFALGLKLNDYKFFDESNHLSLTSGTTLRYLHYPPIPSASADSINKGIIRAGA